ncbi:ribonuclease H-like domain-containing protein [Tanacetum coccineum]|uniref:Ribonuclease H-like domain-containing protein n=1 Tax=Tanacetum coccineum TaxID=301880 RepID=A0ABQ5AKP2_9ASTR
MRIEQYIHMIDYALWEVIENGNTAPKTTVVEGVEKIVPPTNAEEKAQKRLEVKDKSTLMMGIPKEHQLKFNSSRDASCCGNLKRGETLSQEDVNQNLLRSLSPEWNTHAVVWGNNLELETMSIDDLYNNLKVYEPEVKGTSSSNTSTQYMAFYQANAANPINVDNLSDAEICAFFASQPSSPQLSDHAEEGPTNYALMAYSSLSSDSEKKINGLKWDIQVGEITIGELRKKLEIIVDNYKKGLGYNAVLPPLTGNFMPPKPDLSFTGLEEFSNKHVVIKHVVENSEAKVSEAKPKAVRKNNGALIIEDWVSDSEEENGNPQIDLQDKGVIDSGCSRNMTRNMSYLTNYEEIDKGYVAFVGNPKGGKITGKGSRPDWLFDIDALTKIMNYEPIVAGTQSNDFADPKSSQDDGSKHSNDDGKKVDENPRKEINVVSENISIELPFDPKMPALEDDSIFDFLSNNEDDGAKADMNNLDTTIQVSPIANIKNHKDHPLDQVIGDLQSTTLTRKMSQNLEEHGFCGVSNGYKIEEEVYVCQPPGFEDPDFPDKVYKVEKALYGLHQAPRAWYEALSTYLLDNGFQRGKIDKTLFIKSHKVKQKKDGIFISQDKHVSEILKKFGFTEVKTTSTPMETQKPLLKDEDGEEVDVHMYRSMIGSLMYITSSRLDIMFAVYSDYARASLDRKSTTGSCQFLRCRLISWQYKKQIVVANSQQKLNMWLLQVVVDKCFGFRINYLSEGSVIPTDPQHTPTIIQPPNQPQKIQKPKKPKKDTQIPQSSVPTKSVADEAVYKELDDSLVRDATTTSSLEAEQDSSNITKTQSKATPNEPSSPGTNSSGGPKCQETMGDTPAQTSLKRSVKKLEQKKRSRTHGLKRLRKVGATVRVESSGDEESLGEDAFKQGRIDVMDADDNITLVSDHNVDVLDSEEVFGTENKVDVEGVKDGVNIVEEVVEVINAAKLIIDVAQVSTASEKVSAASEKVSAASAATTVSTATTITAEDITLAQALQEMKSTKPKMKGVAIQELSESIIKRPSQISPRLSSQDKGKGIWVEPVNPLKLKDQIRLDEEAALKLQAKFDEEERLAREKLKMNKKPTLP